MSIADATKPRPFDAVVAIESGVTFARFSVNALFKSPHPNDKPFAPPRVDVPVIGTFVSRDHANTLFAKPGMRWLLGCRDTSCCAPGPATDLAMRAAKVDPRLERARTRLEAWRLTLGAMHQAGPPAAISLAPESKRTQRQLRKSA